jgi:urea transport system permease protein
MRNLAAAFFIALFAYGFAPCVARAAAFEDAIAKFTTDSYSDTSDAIAQLTTSGNPRAVDIIEALSEGRLYFDASAKIVVLKTKDEKFSNALTGEAIAGKGSEGITVVRLNNRLRSSIEASLGPLQLLSPSKDKRYDAAQSVFKSREEIALPAVETALAKESDAGVKRALVEARAAILFLKSDAPEKDRIAAVGPINGRGDQDAMSLLRSLPADAPPNVKRAADTALIQLQRGLAIWSIGQNVWYGISLGSVLLLAAIGLAITFGVMGVINMAHGEMVMIGAYVTFVVQELIRNHAPGMFEWSLAIAIPLAFLVAGAIGVAIERGVIRFLYGRPLETLLATWGISLILQQAVRTMFGPTNREVGAPSWMSGSFEVGQLSITYNRLWIIVFSMLVFAALLFVLRHTRFGLEMRAVTQNRPMAAAMGIRTKTVDALTFGLGSGIAGIAGVALSQIDNVSPNLGQSYIIDSFLVVVFGGVGNLFGTLVGALGLGIANKLLEPFAGAVVGKIILLVLIILFIQKRPRGLFALKGRAIEA